MGVCYFLTVEVSGSGKLRAMGRLKHGEHSVGIVLSHVSAKFYNLQPGMYCEFKVIFPDKRNIIDADEVDAIIARQKQYEKIGRAEMQKLRRWLEERKEVYERCIQDPLLKMPEDIRRLFEEPGELQKAINEFRARQNEST